MVKFPGSSALIGRAAEVSVLLDALGDANIQTVLVAGEAGLGKSRLMGEFTERVARDALTLVGRCPELGTDGIAFAPFLAVLRAVLRELGPKPLAALLPPQPALANWLPQLAVHTGPAAPGSDRTRLFGEILTVLEQLAATRPLVLILEDLHWSDDATRELLTFLTTNIADGECLMVGTYRPGAGPLRPLLAELRRNPAVRLLDLPPLTRHEVGRQLAALLGREPESTLITTVFERSGGNPLFVEALGHTPDHLSADLNELLLGFQSGLTPEARVALRTAAVIGSPIRHELLTATADLPSPTLNRALRELIDRHLLLVADTAYDFRHVLIRRAVYEDLLPAERTHLHANVVAALRETSDPAKVDHTAELAHHAAAAGDFRTALTAAWALSENPTTPPLERLRQLERTAAHWNRVPDAARLLGTTKLAVLERTVDQAIACDATERGIVAASAALALADPTPQWTDADASGAAAPGGAALPGAMNDAVRSARIARLALSRAYLNSRGGAGPGADLDRALRLLSDAPATRERAEALAQSAITKLFGGDAVGAEVDAREAADIAEKLGATAVIARAQAYLGLAAAADATTALAHFAQARTAADASGDTRVLLDVATWESAVLVASGRSREAIGVIQQGLRIAHEAFRFHEAAPILLVKWAQALTALGRWAEARELVDETQFDRMPALSRAAVLLCYADIAVAQGDMDRARGDVGAAGALLGEGRWTLPYRLRAQAVRCRISLAEGDQSSAAEVLAEVATRAGDVTALTGHPQEVWPLVVLAAQVPAASADLRALSGALPANPALYGAYSALYAAHVSGSSVSWEQAAAAWSAVEQPYEAAQSLLAAAESHVAEGDRETAAVRLRAASAQALTLGAAPLAEAAVALSRRARIPLGDSAAPASASVGGSSEFGLTARELDVLRLVAKGLSNRALAAELFISANTAGVHVSRILTKLGVASRTEAAAFAHANGLLSGPPS
ncbi:AAA family ATPase [Nocardia huaxiensis]|uniref:AAA family ATPase n=1 Tax=Nocardia huaxiensis TaxID=2755382 RepID=A0A7D6ZDM6_9NOCA|nr:AAA family ATPase [Nocardia huaxiensis]QLY27560.1 AAA family ATPase [Nocardia huaxiensis]